MLIRLHDEIEKRKEELRQACQGLSVTNILDRAGNILKTSDERNVLLGYDAEAQIVQNVFTHCHPDDQGKILWTLTEMVMDKCPGKCDFRLQHRNGCWIPMRGYGVPLVEGDEVSGFVCMYHEIVNLDLWSEKQALEHLLRKIKGKQKRTG